MRYVLVPVGLSLVLSSGGGCGGTCSEGPSDREASPSPQSAKGRAGREPSGSVPRDATAGHPGEEKGARRPATTHRPAMRRVPGGSAELGVPNDVELYATEPAARFRRHEVELDPFWIAETEVTQAQFSAVMGFNPASNRPSGGEDTGCSKAGVGDELPAVCVTWLEAVRYANELSEREGKAPSYRVEGEQVTRMPGARGYRLLTGNEWEYAAKGGEDVRFAGTSSKVGLCAFANILDLLADCTSPYERLAPVGSLRPNGWGLFDMSGNASEWVEGWVYEGSHREVRGGSYDQHPYQFTQVYGYAGRVPNARSASRGLRIAASVGGE